MMRSQQANAKRRLYARKGVPLVCYGGRFYRPSAKAGTHVDTGHEVAVEMAEPSGGRQRVTVSQGTGGKRLQERWVEARAGG